MDETYFDRHDTDHGGFGRAGALKVLQTNGYDTSQILLVSQRKE